jgi:hypothetical protein
MGVSLVRTRDHRGNEAPDGAKGKSCGEAQLLQDHAARGELREPGRLQLVKERLLDAGAEPI